MKIKWWIYIYWRKWNIINCQVHRNEIGYNCCTLHTMHWRQMLSRHKLSSLVLQHCVVRLCSTICVCVCIHEYIVAVVIMLEKTYLIPRLVIKLDSLALMWWYQPKKCLCFLGGLMYYDDHLWARKIFCIKYNKGNHIFWLSNDVLYILEYS